MVFINQMPLISNMRLICMQYLNRKVVNPNQFFDLTCKHYM